MTAFAAIPAAFVAALTGGAAVAPLVEHARRRPLPDDKATGVTVSVLRADGELFAILNGPTDWTTQVLVECYARDQAGLSADAGADALVAAVYARLAADKTLGGLVGDINLTSVEFDYDAAAVNTACIVLTYSVLHRTSHQTLE